MPIRLISDMILLIGSLIRLANGLIRKEGGFNPLKFRLQLLDPGFWTHFLTPHISMSLSLESRKDFLISEMYSDLTWILALPIRE